MTGKTEVVVVCTTVDSEDAAERMARAMVDRRLAACVQRTSIRSVYRWNGVVESANEWLLTAKTVSAQVGPLRSFIQETHSYEVPEIIVLPVTGGSSEYLAWIGAEVVSTVE